MKKLNETKLIFICTIFVLTTFTSCTKKDSTQEYQVTEEEPPSMTEQVIEEFPVISINAVKVKQFELTDIHLTIEESSYPKIVGLDDKSFQKQVNTIFKNNFNSYIDSAKSDAESEENILIEDEKDDPFLSAGTIRSSFEILTKNDHIISILQHFVIEGVGGGNNWSLSSVVTNCDLKNSTILKQSDMNMNAEKIDLINAQIREYFNIQFSDEGYIDYPTIESKEKFDKLHFGIRNDSIMLVIEAMPTAHYSYGTYIIPIEKKK
jgi:hypothetical protein